MTPTSIGGDTIHHAGGASYVQRCVAVGRGPKAGSFGEVEELDLYLHFEERIPVPFVASP